MTIEEYKKWEEEAIARGYRKHWSTSSSNEYSYCKTIGKDVDSRRYHYMIEWRVWDFSAYDQRNKTLMERPYSLEVNIMPDNFKFDMRLDMLIGDPLELGFDKVEEMAEHYYEFILNEGL